MFGQEDFNAEVNDDNCRTLNYISKHIDDPEHEGCVFLKLCDCSGAAEEWSGKRHPNRNYADCYVEVEVMPEEMKELRKIMLKMLKKVYERGY